MSAVTGVFPLPPRMRLYRSGHGKAVSFCTAAQGHSTVAAELTMRRYDGHPSLLKGSSLACHPELARSASEGCQNSTAVRSAPLISSHTRPGGNLNAEGYAAAA